MQQKPKVGRGRLSVGYRQKHTWLKTFFESRITFTTYAHGVWAPV
jgi:hypothetical protein